MGLEPQTSPTRHEHCNNYTTVLSSNRFGPRPVPIPGIISNSPGSVVLFVVLNDQEDIFYNCVSFTGPIIRTTNKIMEPGPLETIPGMGTGLGPNLLDQGTVV